MFKLMLNLRKPNNYAFFCPVSKVHLTVSNPVGYANEVTPAILTAIKVKTVLDVDGVINLEAGTLIESKPVKSEGSPNNEPQKAVLPEPEKDKGSTNPEEEEKEEGTTTPSADETSSDKQGSADGKESSVEESKTEETPVAPRRGKRTPKEPK